MSHLRKSNLTDALDIDISGLTDLELVRRNGGVLESAGLVGDTGIYGQNGTVGFGRVVTLTNTLAFNGGFVGIDSPSAVSTEKFRVGGFARFNSGAIVGNTATAIADALSLPDQGKVSIGATTVISTDVSDNTLIDAAQGGNIHLRNNSDVVGLEFGSVLGGLSMVWNEDGVVGADIRMEGGADQNLFVLDAGLDFIGISTATQSADAEVFRVDGTQRIDGSLRVEDGIAFGADAFLANQIIIPNSWTYNHGNTTIKNVAGAKTEIFNSLNGINLKLSSTNVMQLVPDKVGINIVPTSTLTVSDNAAIGGSTSDVAKLTFTGFGGTIGDALNIKFDEFCDFGTYFPAAAKMGLTWTTWDGAKSENMRLTPEGFLQVADGVGIADTASLFVKASPLSTVAAKFRGRGTTNTTYGLFVENNLGTQILSANDGGQVRMFSSLALGLSTAYNGSGLFMASNHIIQIGGTTMLQVNGANETLLHASSGDDIKLLNTADATMATFSGFSGGGQLLMGTTTQDTSALVVLESSTRGFLPPRMTTAERDAIAAPTEGLIIYNETTQVLNFYNGTSWGAV